MAAPAAEDHGGPAPPTTVALEVPSIGAGPREIQVAASLEERCTSAGYPPTVLEAMASHTVVGFPDPKLKLPVDYLGQVDDLRDHVRTLAGGTTVAPRKRQPRSRSTRSTLKPPRSSSMRPSAQAQA